MIAVKIPHDWTPAEANAAITLFEAVLTALWRQYPEPSDEYIASYLNDSAVDRRNLYEPEPPPDEEKEDCDFSSDIIPF